MVDRTGEEDRYEHPVVEPAHRLQFVEASDVVSGACAQVEVIFFKLLMSG